MNISDKQVSFPEIPKGHVLFFTPDNNQAATVKALSCLPISVLLLSKSTKEPT